MTVTAPYTGSARRVYFDAQQFNYFAGPDTSPHPEHALHRVSRAVKAGKIEVVGSLDLLQEVIEAFPQAGKKARRMVDLFFKLVGDRLLLPLSERHRQETSTGGVLSEEDRYLSRELRRDVRRLAQSGRDVFELANELHREKVAFLSAERAVQEKMRDRLIEEGATKPARLMREWIADVDLDDWVRDIADAGRQRGRVPDHVSVGPEQTPSASAFVAIRLARLARTMGEGRKIQDSDLADAHHVACGPYIDVLVTDDKELRSTLALVRARLSLERESSAEFFATLP
ncbi:MAG TPA: hypothetical protein VM242_06095 [Acidimicrobiales bacterium]|nr:hypothetical protein [Acidimicrobiales bacterium]